MMYAIMFLGKTIREMGAMVLFAKSCMGTFFSEGLVFRELVHQMYDVGVRSLFTTVVTGIFVGAIMAIQINLQLRDFGAQGFLGGLSTSVTIRNVGPVLIAFILSGKVGAYTSAELGTMRVTDQINAIRCLGVNPIQSIVLPRLVAVMVSSTLLLLVGLMVTIAGGVLISSAHLGINPAYYLHHIPTLVTWWSVGLGLIKSVFFGAVIGIIACYKGYFCEEGTVGVGNAVRATSVSTLVAILVVNYVLSSLGSAVLEAVGNR